MYQEILVIEDTENIINILKNIFKEKKDYIFISSTANNFINEFKSIPDLIIIDEDNISINIIDLCLHFRNSGDGLITPIIVISSNSSKEHELEILENDIEYFIPKPIDNEILYYTIKNIIRLMSSNRKVSPLTGLPGNVQIQIELRKRLLKKEEFDILYFDLDNFKEYNDTYGFMMGDEIIKFTANLILKVLHTYKPNDSFVGHIGGDDFVGITSSADYDLICQEIITKFDSGIKKYFSEIDIERGYLEVANRKGIIEQFPITAISIGVVNVEPGEYTNHLEIGEVGAQVKHLAKTQIGSAYVLNRRKK